MAFVANVIDACEGAPLRVQDEVALGRGEQPADLASLWWLEERKEAAKTTAR